MLMNLRPRRLRLILLAAVVATAALAFGSTARADASTQLINAGSIEFGPPALAMEVAPDGTDRVFLQPPNPQSFRQQWQKEPVVNGQSRYRNKATNKCLIVPAVAGANDDLLVGPCSGVGARNMWTRKNVVVGNGAFMLISAHSGLVPFPNFCASPSNLLKLTTEDGAALLGSWAEYVGA